MRNCRKKNLSLALQGGGAHGAFTWGVLDKFLESEKIIIDSISATSAGAMNASILVEGYRKGGREGARKELKKFWRSVNQIFSKMSPR